MPEVLEGCWRLADVVDTAGGAAAGSRVGIVEREWEGSSRWETCGKEWTREC